MKKIYLSIILLVSTSIASAQCITTAVPNQTVIDCGDSVIITLSGYADFALNNDFNTGTAGVGWAATSSAQFNNPYVPSLSNDTYLWMGPLADVPRELTSLPLDLSFGGQICFDLVYAIQGNASPVEGPDEPDEGVSLQYSIDGGLTWVDISYFQPNGNILTSNPGPAGVGGATGVTPFTSWGTYCFPIPPGAQTATTQIQWSQIFSSTAQFDHWGLDNIQIFVSDPAYGFFDTDGSFVSSNVDVVYPIADSTFVYTYTNGIDDTCSASVNITVNPTDAGPDILVSCDGIGFNMQVTGVAPWATVSWSPIDGLADGNDPNTFALPFQDTEYTVTSACGTDDVMVFVEDAFTISMNQPDTICLNGATFLSLSTSPSSVGIASVSWDNVETLQDSMGNPVLAQPFVTTTYVATVTSDSGCVIQDSVILYVNGIAAEVAVTPANPNVCQGSPINLTAGYLTPTVPYTLVQGAYNPYPTTGGTVIGGFTDNSNQGPLPLGFNFPFFGTNYNQLWLCSNGWITFTNPTSTTAVPTVLPSAAAPNNIIAWAWDDINWTLGGGTFSYYTGGVAPNQYLVLNFINAPLDLSTQTVSVQVVLYQNGLIEMNNISVVPASGTGLMTQGIENASGTIGVVNPSFNNANFTSIGETWLYIPFVAPVNPTYTWSPPTYLNTAVGANVTSTPNGEIEYFITMEDGFCTSVGSVTVTVDTISFSSIINDLSVACEADSIQLFAVGQTTVFNDLTCGPAGTCSSAQQLGQVGTSTSVSGTTTTGNTGNTPFGYWFSNNKRHILYTAAELNAMGFTGGNLYSLAFNITQKNTSDTYLNMGISMKCTSATSVANITQTGFTDVFSTPTYNTTAGWNTFTFDSPYMWDGVSNLLIQFCWGNGVTGYDVNDHVQVSPAAATCYAWGYNDNINGVLGCNYTGYTSTGTSTSKPNTRFNFCNITPGFADISYSWTSSPAYSFNNASIIDPILLDTITGPTQVFVEITDGICTTVDTIEIALGGSYTLSSDTALCAGETLQVLATGGLSYTWSAINTSLNNTSIANPVTSALVSDATLYVDIELSNCTVSDSIAITVNPLPTATINGGSSTVQSCTGDTVSLSSDADPTWNYAWLGPENGTGSSIDVTTPGTYVMSFSDANGCNNFTNIIFTNYAVPTASINNQSAQDFRCPLSSIILTSDANPAWNYSWTGPESGTGNSISVSTDGLYTLSFVDLNSCEGSTTILVSSFDTIVLNTNLVRNILCCNGDAVSFVMDSLVTNGLGIAEVYWDGSVSSSLSPITVSSLEDGTYPVRIIDVNGCESNAYLSFETKCIEPIIDDVGSVVVAQQVDYTVSTAISADSETWYPSAAFVGNTYTGPLPGNSLENVAVELSANFILNSGQNFTCVESDSSIIFVISVSNPEMPNAFTPNGDALNARFFPVNLDANSSISAFRVYNRWGDLVYEYNNDLGWDGSWSGQDQPEDVYNYYLVIDKSSENLVLSGTVTLIR
jgi:gliding motility-associated-like protein